MNQVEFEIPLTIDWLNARQQYDLQARSPRLLNEFLSHMTSFDQPKIADIGCGTGNNVLSIAKLLKKDTSWYLVERESDLLNEAKRRIKKEYPDILEETEETLVVRHRNNTFTFHFFNELIDSFLNKVDGIHAVISSALFDLFTEEEMSSMFQILKGKKVTIYSVMNYTGVEFDPSDQYDDDYISCFESHMSRKLSKGQPMGANTMSCIKRMVNDEESISWSSEDSVWLIPEKDQSFLNMNLQFYREGILSNMNKDNKGQFNSWFSNKKELLNHKKLNLKVFHQDFTIRFA